MYSRMLGLSGLPTQLSNWIGTIDAGLPQILAIYLVLLIALGTIIDSMSIILITVPLFLPLVKPLGADLVWFGIVTVIAVEIGLLTPPFGISVFVVRSALAETRISLGDVFIGAAPFAATMFLVLLLIVFVPKLSLILL